MNYVEKNLSKDERIIKGADVSMIALVPTAIGAVIVLILLGVVNVFLGIIAAAIIIGVKILKIKTTELALTNRKILGKFGIISTKVMDSPLNKLNSISVEQGLFGKIFGYGKVIIATSSGGYNFDYISHPDSFRSAVMEQIDTFDEERVRKQAEQMASAMKQ